MADPAVQRQAAMRRDYAPRDEEGRCAECHAEIGHYNGCGQDPDPECRCPEVGCPYHTADPETLVYPP
jgi:hypothetical protein